MHRVLDVVSPVSRWHLLRQPRRVGCFAGAASYRHALAAAITMLSFLPLAVATLDLLCEVAQITVKLRAADWAVAQVLSKVLLAVCRHIAELPGHALRALGLVGTRPVIKNSRPGTGKIVLETLSPRRHVEAEGQEGMRPAFPELLAESRNQTLRQAGLSQDVLLAKHNACRAQERQPRGSVRELEPRSSQAGEPCFQCELNFVASEAAAEPGQFQVLFTLHGLVLQAGLEETEGALQGCVTSWQNFSPASSTLDELICDLGQAAAAG
mmetsp:Transcript_29876/g.56000  ORF Transcript_29876/g.56000 Transcript_29876/m.56000 type:complete len:268 (+) Transcript_29876:333-1136(+)